MSQDPSRRSNRVDVNTRARIRGVCGDFNASTEDLSLTGVRVRIPRAELRIDENADLATAAATVQTRIGSRCVLELGLRQMQKGVSKRVEIIRLVLLTATASGMDLGCQFEEPLTEEECRTLRVRLPSEEGVATVRSTLSWAEESRPRLDPSLCDEKVETLLDVETAHAGGPGERVPRRALRAILTSSEGRAYEPLTCTAESLSASTILMRVNPLQAGAWLDGARDLSEVAQFIQLDYGDWPDLEIVQGSRRVWRGRARVFGLEVGGVGEQDMFLRLVFSRRLPESALDRICDAA